MALFCILSEDVKVCDCCLGLSVVVIATHHNIPRQFHSVFVDEEYGTS